MASYNGASYIKKQIESILPQLSGEDELVISDDASTDNTLKIIQSFRDNRIVLLSASVHSPVYNFENALKKAKGDYIFLTDQDDVWMADKVERIIEKFKKNPNVELILHNRSLIDGNDVLMKSNVYPIGVNILTTSLFNHLYKNRFMGCCMAFRKELLRFALPFPSKLPMHDSWLGLLAQFRGTSLYIDQPLILYRRHSSNVTTGHSPYSVFFRVIYRMRLLYKLIYRLCYVNCFGLSVRKHS